MVRGASGTEYVTPAMSWAQTVGTWASDFKRGVGDESGMDREGKTALEQAMLLIAVYDVPDGGKYEREIVRLARKWRRIIKSPLTTQGVVNRLIEDIDIPRPANFGCGWDNLRRAIIEWAVAGGWLEPQDAIRLDQRR